MKHAMQRIPVVALLLAAITAAAACGTPQLRRSFTLSGGKLRCTVTLEAGHIVSERLTLTGGTRARASRGEPEVETDGGFSLDLMWSDWRPPGKKNNAENPVFLTARDFTFVGADSAPGKFLRLSFAGPDGALALRVTYAPGAGGFYMRRSVSVMDTAEAGHLLRTLRGSDCLIRGKAALLKAGASASPRP